MRRKTMFFAFAGVVCVAAGLAALPHLLTAQQNTTTPKFVGVEPPGPNGAKGNGTVLPVKKVILFTSGVGYFQREGQVEGEARVDLSFPVQDINDLLKSLVLRDLDGGKIRTVSYDSQAPLDKTLKSFAVNLSGNPGFADILEQARGEKVMVSYIPLAAVQPLTVTGTIVSVEKKKQPINKDAAVDTEYVNIWGDKGLASIKLTDVVQVQFQSSAISSELNRALEVVAQGHDTQKKSVSLLFSGKGKRNVQVGYVVEHPIWRTSYRLVLSKDAKPFLQGWGLVENPTSEDWNNVNLSLVSGRPVSFKMDLYQPLYVYRPTVALQLFQNLKPTTYEGEMDKAPSKKMDDKGKALAPMAPPPPPADGPGFPGGGFGAGGPILKDSKKAVEQMQHSVASAAQGVQLGDQFSYLLKQPVSVARQKSALVPIITANVEATRVSIFNEHNLPKFPMLGLRFKNTTGDPLMQGPVTVFDEDSYAGDAIINDLQKNEERLLSYAVDLATEVKTAANQSADPKIIVSLNKGILHKTITLRETRTYTVKNRGDQAKLVILEHPIRTPDWKLVTPAKEPAKTQSYYRFELNVPADASKKFEVVEERKVFEEIVLTNQSSQVLATLIAGKNLSPALKAALQKAIELKSKQAKTDAEIAKLNAKLNVIKDDQARQRDNMKVIPQGDPVYKEYLTKFLKQEKVIDATRAQIEELQAAAEQQRQTYEDYVLNITLKAEKE